MTFCKLVAHCWMTFVVVVVTWGIAADVADRIMPDKTDFCATLATAEQQLACFDAQEEDKWN